MKTPHKIKFLAFLDLEGGDMQSFFAFVLDDSTRKHSTLLVTDGGRLS